MNKKNCIKRYLILSVIFVVSPVLMFLFVRTCIKETPIREVTILHGKFIRREVKAIPVKGSEPEFVAVVLLESGKKIRVNLPRNYQVKSGDPVRVNVAESKSGRKHYAIIQANDW